MSEILLKLMISYFFSAYNRLIIEAFGWDLLADAGSCKSPQELACMPVNTIKSAELLRDFLSLLIQV